MSFKQPRDDAATKPAAGAPKRRRTAEAETRQATSRRQRSSERDELELPDPAATEQERARKEERKAKRRRTALGGQADEDETDEDEGQSTWTTADPQQACTREHHIRRLAKEAPDQAGEGGTAGGGGGEEPSTATSPPVKLRNVALAERVQRLPGLARRLAEEITTPPLLPARPLIHAVTGLADNKMGSAWSTVTDVIKQAQERKLVDAQLCVSRDKALEFLTFVAEQDKWSKGLRHQVYMALERKWHEPVFVEVDQVLKRSSSSPSAPPSKQPASASSPPPPSKSSSSSSKSSASSSSSSSSSSTSTTSSSSPSSSSSSASPPAPVKRTVGPRAVPRTSTVQPDATIGTVAGQSPLPPPATKQAAGSALPQPTMAVGSSPSPICVAALGGAASPATNDVLLREAMEYARPLLEACGRHHWERAQFACGLAQLWKDPTGGGILPVACLMVGLIDPECSASQREAGQDPVFLHVYGLGMRLGLPSTDQRLHKLHTLLSQVYHHGFTKTSTSAAPAEEVALVLDAHELWSLHPLQLMRSPNAISGGNASGSSSASGDDRTGSWMEAKLVLAQEQAKGLRTESGKKMAALLLLSRPS